MIRAAAIVKPYVATFMTHHRDGDLPTARQERAGAGRPVRRQPATGRELEWTCGTP